MEGLRARGLKLAEGNLAVDVGLEARADNDPDTGGPRTVADRRLIVIERRAFAPVVGQTSATPYVSLAATAAVLIAVLFLAGQASATPHVPPRPQRPPY